MTENKTETVPFQKVLPSEVRVGDLVEVGRQVNGRNRTGTVTSIREEYSEQMNEMEIVMTVDLDGGETVTERHGFLAEMRRLGGSAVQAVDNTTTHSRGWHRSYTELARIVASHCGWAITDDGTVFQADGHIVCDSIEGLARALFALQWIGPRDGGLSGIHWTPMPNVAHDDTIADAVRDFVASGEDWTVGRTTGEVLKFLGLSSVESDALAGARD